MKKLLVPVDFSDYTWSTVTAALDLAARIDAEVRLLHVFDDPFVESDLDDTTIRNAVSRYTENLLHKMETDAKTQMADLKTKIDGYQADRKLSVSVSTEIERGFPVDTIVASARRWVAQLIIMGSRGHSKMERLMFGTITKGVISQAHCAVLSLPAGIAWQPPQKVLYASDFSSWDEIAIARILNLLDAYKVTLHVTHFSESRHDEDAFKLHQLEEKLRQDHKSERIRYEVVDSRVLLSAMKEYIDSNDIDLLALTTRKLSGLQRIFTRSTAIDVLYHTNKPLLVFHEK